MWNADSQASLGWGRTRLSFDLGEFEVPGAILMAGR